MHLAKCKQFLCKTEMQVVYCATPEEQKLWACCPQGSSLSSSASLMAIVGRLSSRNVRYRSTLRLCALAICTIV